MWDKLSKFWATRASSWRENLKKRNIIQATDDFIGDKIYEELETNQDAKCRHQIVE